MLGLSTTPAPRYGPHRTAVIAVGFGYDWARFALFIVPLRQHYDGDIFILTIPGSASPDVLRLFSEQRVQVRELACSKGCVWPKCGSCKAEKVVVERFTEVAGICDVSYNMCLSTDLRDVVFQADPFAKLLANGSTHDVVLHCEDLSKRIGTSSFNRLWFSHCYGGRSMYTDIRFKCIINAGVIFATPRGFRALADEIPKPCTHRKNSFHGKDQVTLNWLYHGGHLNKSGLSTMLYQRDDTRAVADSMRYNADAERNGRRRWRLDYAWPERMPFVQYEADMRTPVPLLHQYDIDRYIRDILELWLANVQERARGRLAWNASAMTAAVLVHLAMGDPKATFVERLEAPRVSLPVLEACGMLNATWHGLVSRIEADGLFSNGTWDGYGCRNGYSCTPSLIKRSSVHSFCTRARRSQSGSI